MSSNIEIDKNCEYCGKLYTARTLYTRYCSHTCNKKGYKAIKRGDNIQLKAILTAPGEDLQQIFWVKITDPEKPKEKTPKADDENDKIGLPPLVFAYKDIVDKGTNVVSWDAVEESTWV